MLPLVVMCICLHFFLKKKKIFTWILDLGWNAM